MDFTNLCRTCLSTSSLSPIFSYQDDAARYSTAIYISSGVKVELNDGLPQNMCNTCITFINNFLSFRKQCKESENKLLLYKNETIHNCKSETELNEEIVHHTDINTLEISNGISDEKKHVSQYYENDDNGLDSKQHNEQNCDEVEEKKLWKQRITCALCSQSLLLRSLANHMARRHSGHGEKFFKCGYCKTVYETKEKLVEHVKTCTAKKKRSTTSESCKEMAECDICKKSMQKASLKMHMKIKHAGLGPVCEHCGRRFGNKFRLNEHYRAKHDYEKFKCSYCDFQSAAVMAMRNHERRHRGEKPFVCETCGAKFHAAYLLAQHKQSHRTEKVYKCNLCGASFKANNSLHMHKSTCHSSRLYKCALCSRSYACRHYVVKHMRHVHSFSGAVPKLQVMSNGIQQMQNDFEPLVELWK